jgi:hypothetical protein
MVLISALLICLVKDEAIAMVFSRLYKFLILTVMEFLHWATELITSKAPEIQLKSSFPLRKFSHQQTSNILQIFSYLSMVPVNSHMVGGQLYFWKPVHPYAFHNFLFETRNSWSSFTSKNSYLDLKNLWCSYCVVVCHRINCNSLDAHFFSCSYHPAGNFSSIGDENLVKATLILIKWISTKCWKV